MRQQKRSKSAYGVAHEVELIDAEMREDCFRGGEGNVDDGKVVGM